MWFTIIEPKWGQIVVRNGNKLVLAHTPAHGFHFIDFFLAPKVIYKVSNVLNPFSTVDFKYMYIMFCSTRCMSLG